MKYYVTYRVDARYTVGVDANSLDEAFKLAEENYIDADFGEISDVVSEDVIIVEDSNGNFVYER